MSTATTDPVREVLSRLPDAKPTGNGQWKARCPAHEDRIASLSISTGENGSALLWCHAGCTFDAIIAKLADPAKVDDNRVIAALAGQLLGVAPED